MDFIILVDIIIVTHMLSILVYRGTHNLFLMTIVSTILLAGQAHNVTTRNKPSILSTASIMLDSVNLYPLFEHHKPPYRAPHTCYLRTLELNRIFFLGLIVATVVYRCWEPIDKSLERQYGQREGHTSQLITLLCEKWLNDHMQTSKWLNH